MRMIGFYIGGIARAVFPTVVLIASLILMFEAAWRGAFSWPAEDTSGTIVTQTVVAAYSAALLRSHIRRMRIERLNRLIAIEEERNGTLSEQIDALRSKWEGLSEEEKQVLLNEGLRGRKDKK